MTVPSDRLERKTAVAYFRVFCNSCQKQRFYPIYMFFRTRKITCSECGLEIVNEVVTNEILWRDSS